MRQCQRQIELRGENKEISCFESSVGEIGEDQVHVLWMDETGGSEEAPV
jgi:hypothetical protein